MRRTPWILLALAAMLAGGATPAPTPEEEGPPAAPVLIGTFQPGVSGGACAAWSGSCATTTLEPVGDRWAVTLVIPAGGWRWRVAVDGDPSRSIGVGTRFDGDDAVLQFAQPRPVTFVFEPGRRAATASADRTFGYAWQLDGPCTGEGPAPPPIDPATALLDPDGDGISTTMVEVADAAACLRVVDAAGRAVDVEPQGLTGAVEVAFDGRAGTARAWPAGPPAEDGRLDPLGFAHDSRDLAYRLPAGAAPAGSAIRLRFRTFHADATGVALVVTDAEADAETRLEMARVAGPAPCGEDVVDEIAPCDWWEATVTPPDPTTLTYRFEVTDGTTRSFYADDPPLDGGCGATTRLAVNAGYVITIHVPGVEPVPWLDGAVVYQVFPDRYRNGDPANDADVDAPRYGWPRDDEDRNRRRAWTDLPESPGRGRDWFGGDLAGIEANLPYLADLGVSVLYLNPVFAAASNHLYDTRDYREIDPRFGDGAAWRSLVAAAGELGIRIVLDGVFNHVSSDSPYFDRYGHFSQVGACESVGSPFRTWFVFVSAAGGPCAGPDGPRTMDYVGWSGLASLPVLVKTDAGVQSLVYGDANAVARRWLQAGAAGWRLDVMMDPSFAGGFWQAFRAAVKATDPEAAIVGELWSRSQVLPQVRGDAADTTMNYRFRNAVTGYLGTVDREGFPDSGESDQPPSLLARKLLSMYEDYPAFAARTAWNLLDSHDTERILWSLAPGEPKDRETPASLAVGKARLRLASLLQFTLPGAPTIYYGDEIGMTGADDPDDRRTFPVLGEDGVLPASADAALHAWYRDLAATRRDVAVLRDGAVRFLVTDDRARTLAFSRYDEDGALAIIALNPDPERPATIEIPLADARGPGSPVPDGIRFEDRTGTVAAPPPSAAGTLQVALPALGAAILVPAAGADLAPPAAPAGLAASAADGVRLTWAPVVDAAGYRVQRSALLDGPAVDLGEVAIPGFADGDVEPGSWVYTVRAFDAAGNVGPAATVEAALEPAATAAPGATPGGATPGEASGGTLPVSGAALVALAGIALGLAVLVAVRRRSVRP
jgi:glycosidase